MKNRIDWIDWMKAIGIYLIVLGHFFPVGYEYIYVFSVPLFFILSGFLSHKEDEGIFWKKLWFNLVVPLLIIIIFNVGRYTAVHYIQGDLILSNVTYSCLACLLGMGGKGIDVAGLGTGWFVYTLIVSKIIFQKCPPQICIILSILFCLITILIVDIRIPNNAFVNTMEAFPLFIIGHHFRKLETKVTHQINKYYLLMIIVLSILIVAFCGTYNGYVQMFQNLYGRNFILFLVGGIGGTIGIWAFCRLLGKTNCVTMTISKGTIIIMGFHVVFIKSFQENLGHTFIADYSGAIILTLLFVPIIYFSEHYFPYLIGKMRAKD